MVEFLSKSEEMTKSLGAILASALSDTTPGTVIGMTGTLGSGKTALVRGILVGLGIESGQVVSPTYGIVAPYVGRLPVLHMDAYRIESIDELDELGLDEQVEQGATLICEWFERVESGLPELDLVVQASPQGETERLYELFSRSRRGEAILRQIETQRIQQNRE